MKFVKTACFLTLLCLAAAALGQGTYTQIDVPDALETSVYGIDAAGNMTGWYVDSSGRHHGFLLKSGAFATIDYPGASDTQLFGINDSGKLVGFTGVPVVGFTYDMQTQIFTTIAFPNATETFPTTISNAGKVGGYFSLNQSEVGFVFFGGRGYRRVNPVGAASSVVTSVNGALGGTLGHIYSHAGAYVNFDERGANRYTQLNIPHAPGAVVLGAPPNGSELVGYYVPDPEGYSGFIFQNKILQTLQFPGSNQTAVTGVNSAGEVVGLC